MVSKWLWKQVYETKGFGFTSQIREDNLKVPTEIPQKLAACAARSRQLIRVGDNNDPDEGVCPFRKCLEQGNAFRANRQTITGTLNVAAGKNPAVVAEQRRADLEVRVLSLCAPAHLSGCVYQGLVSVFHAPPSKEK
jgi:hypothetical protein